MIEPRVIVLAVEVEDMMAALGFIIFIQRSLIVFLFAFYFKKIYVTIIHSKSFVSRINANFAISETSNRAFSLFTYTLTTYALSCLLFALFLIFAGIENHISWLIMIMLFIAFPNYFVIFPAFVLIERPQTTYLQSLATINKSLRGKRIRLTFITFIAATIFLFVQMFIVGIVTGYVSYEIIQSKGRVATTGLLFSAWRICDFIFWYIGMITYVKLSLNLYLNFISPNPKDVIKYVNKSSRRSPEESKGGN